MNKPTDLSLITKTLVGWFLATGAWALIHWAWVHFGGRFRR